MVNMPKVTMPKVTMPKMPKMGWPLKKKAPDGGAPSEAAEPAGPEPIAPATPPQLTDAPAPLTASNPTTQKKKSIWPFKPKDAAPAATRPPKPKNAKKWSMPFTLHDLEGFGKKKFLGQEVSKNTLIRFITDLLTINVCFALYLSTNIRDWMGFFAPLYPMLIGGLQLMPDLNTLSPGTAALTSASVLTSACFAGLFGLTGLVLAKVSTALGIVWMLINAVASIYFLLASSQYFAMHVCIYVAFVNWLTFNGFFTTQPYSALPDYSNSLVATAFLLAGTNFFVRTILAGIFSLESNIRRFKRSTSEGLQSAIRLLRLCSMDMDSLVWHPNASGAESGTEDGIPETLVLPPPTDMEIAAATAEPPAEEGHVSGDELVVPLGTTAVPSDVVPSGTTAVPADVEAAQLPPVPPPVGPGPVAEANDNGTFTALSMGVTNAQNMQRALGRKARMMSMPYLSAIPEDALGARQDEAVVFSGKGHKYPAMCKAILMVINASREISSAASKLIVSPSAAEADHVSDADLDCEALSRQIYGHVATAVNPFIEECVGRLSTCAMSLEGKEQLKAKTDPKSLQPVAPPAPKMTYTRKEREKVRQHAEQHIGNGVHGSDLASNGSDVESALDQDMAPESGSLVRAASEVNRSMIKAFTELGVATDGKMTHMGLVAVWMVFAGACFNLAESVEELEDDLYDYQAKKKWHYRDVIADWKTFLAKGGSVHDRFINKADIMGPRIMAKANSQTLEPRSLGAIRAVVAFVLLSFIVYMVGQPLSATAAAFLGAVAVLLVPSTGRGPLTLLIRLLLILFAVLWSMVVWAACEGDGNQAGTWFFMFFLSIIPCWYSRVPAVAMGATLSIVFLFGTMAGYMQVVHLGLPTMEEETYYEFAIQMYGMVIMGMVVGLIVWITVYARTPAAEVRRLIGAAAFDLFVMVARVKALINRGATILDEHSSGSSNKAAKLASLQRELDVLQEMDTELHSLLSKATEVVLPLKVEIPFVPFHRVKHEQVIDVISTMASILSSWAALAVHGMDEWWWEENKDASGAKEILKKQASMAPSTALQRRDDAKMLLNPAGRLTSTILALAATSNSLYTSKPLSVPTGLLVEEPRASSRAMMTYIRNYDNIMYGTPGNELSGEWLSSSYGRFMFVGLISMGMLERGCGELLLSVTDVLGRVDTEFSD